jgi:hypothetical protein
MPTLLNEGVALEVLRKIDLGVLFWLLLELWNRKRLEGAESRENERRQ